MKAALARFAYSTLLRLATPLYFLRLWRRGRREPLYRSAWGERLGFGEGPQETGRLWIHAVSLGETRAAAALIDALRQRRPALRVLLTHAKPAHGCCVPATRRPGCRTTRRARCAASSTTISPRWAC